MNLPTVVLLNFRDKLEEDAVAKASEKAGARRTPPPLTEASAAAAADSPPDNDGNAQEASAAGTAGGADGAPDHPGTEQVAGGRDVGGGSSSSSGSVKGGGTGGAWDHVVTLETARMMMERVREADEAAGRGSGRRVSLFDCSMKNCFGLRVSDRPVSY